MNAPLIRILGSLLSAMMLWEMGCSGPSHHGAPDSTAEASARGAEDPGAPVTFALTHEAAGGATLPVPLVEVEVADARALMIVDSGSTHHVFTESFAERHDLKAVRPAQTGRDHAGGQVRYRSLGAVAVRLGGEALDLREALRMPGPPVFDKLGIAGFLSPQRLTRNGVVILDFPRGEGHLYPHARNGGALMARRHGSFDARASAPVPGPYMKIALAGQEPVIAKLDTGGSATEFSATALGVTLEGQREGGTAMSGAQVAGKRVPGQTVEAAGAQIPDLTVLAVGQPSAFEDDEHARALVGMDVLRHCVVMLPQQNRASARFACASPDSDERPTAP